MQIHASAVIHHPVARVYHAYRDELPQVAAFMANIKEVKILRSEPYEGGVKLHNEWSGRGEIPKVAQGILRPDMVKWDDYADWHDATRRCDWRIATRFFTNSVKCHGTTTLTEEGPDRSRIIVQGDLTIDLKEVPGVPRFLAGSVAPHIERFIIAMIKPNMEQVNVALEQFLNAQKG